jgi:hypothetical protein
MQISAQNGRLCIHVPNTHYVTRMKNVPELQGILQQAI